MADSIEEHTLGILECWAGKIESLKLLPKYPPVEGAIDLQWELREVAPSLCHRRCQGHVPSGGLLHGFLQVPTASTGEENHTLGRLVLGSKFGPKECLLQHLTPKISPFLEEFLTSINLYEEPLTPLFLGPQMSTLNLASPGPKPAAQSDKHLGRQVHTRSNHPNICPCLRSCHSHWSRSPLPPSHP